ncbi:MAG TPA: hypothetical protein VHB98_12570, partial [Chloroflexota bacterium]|nr:hypothetical protein [Chloroflexota bacterium]
PLVAIGGITATHAPALRAAGADGICAIASVIGASDPERAARALLAAVETQMPRMSSDAADVHPVSMH